jgi:23S rRNA-/tRNA-specific pseudouridylate synthase
LNNYDDFEHFDDDNNNDNNNDDDGQQNDEPESSNVKVPCISTNTNVDDIVDGSYTTSTDNVIPNTTLAEEEATTPTFTVKQLQLLELISTIPRHCDTKGNELRPCHQLDYATSGILLIARSKHTAARARNAFEDRKVHKMYTAVVMGHIQIPHNESYYNKKSIESIGNNPDDTIHHWSYVTKRMLEATMERLEYNYRKSRHRHHKVTFHGYLPESNIYARWQDQQRIIMSNKHPKTDKKPPPDPYDLDGPFIKKQKQKRKWNKKHDVEWDTIFEDVDTLSYDIKRVIVKIKWSNLKNSENTMDRAIVQKFVNATKLYNATASENITFQKRTERIIDEALPTLPAFFRVKEHNKETISDSSNVDDDEEKKESFYIFAPLAQDDITNNFAMLLHPNQHYLCPYLRKGDPTMHEYKPSLTKCTVLHRTYIQHQQQQSITSTGMNQNDQSIPVTIVQLEPYTGRRHQLRIHTAMLGHPILGDATYCNNNDNDIENNDHMNHETIVENNVDRPRRTIVDRLCLHSSSLRIPNLVGKGIDFNIQSESPFRYHQSTNCVTIDAI